MKAPDEMVHNVKIPTEHSDANLVQFDWSRISRKWLLYINKSPEQEFWNFVEISKIRSIAYNFQL